MFLISTYKEIKKKYELDRQEKLNINMIKASKGKG